MILGYTIIPQDNKYNMFENIILNECAKYSNTYIINLIDTSIILSTKKNISTTYDGFYIVSEKFKQFCEDEQYRGLEFVKLPKSPFFYWFKIHNIVKFDTEARNTRFLNYSEKCNGYESVIGANPAYLKNKAALQDSFFRTDIFFGSYAAKSPLYIVGEITMQKLKAAGFKEIYFEKILDEYPKKD